MKELLRCSICIIFVNVLVIASSQKPFYPKPGTKADIPFGQKLPMTAPVQKNAKPEQAAVDKNIRDLSPAYLDKTTNSVVQNRPGINTSNTMSPFRSIKVGAKQPSGNPSGFHLLKDINTTVLPLSGYPENFAMNSPYQFAVLNNVSYFSADDGVHGRELWRSDGTNAGTYMVKDIIPGGIGPNIYNIISANGLLYFTASESDGSDSISGGSEPWVSDGTSDGTHLLKKINVASPRQYVNVNGTVYFTGNFDSQLWKTDGTESGTVLVKDLQQSSTGYSILELTGANGLAYFIAYTWASGFQLFRSDGTDAGTYVVKETGYFGFGYDFSAPMQLTAYDNKLFFSVDDGFGRKLWVSDGSLDGTHYAPGYNEVLMQTDYMNIYNNKPFPILNNQLFIAGYLPSDAGGGLYKYDASNDLGEVLVKDLTDIPDFPGDDVGDFVVPVDFVIVGNELCFKVISSIGAWHDELWRSGGEAGNTYLVKTIGITDVGAYSYNFTDGNGIMYFNVNNEPGYGNELWKSDGTEAGTVLVKDFYPGEIGSYPDNLTFCNGRLLFRVNTVSDGIELGQSDGSDAGTTLVKDINSTVHTDNSNAGFWYKGLAALGNEVLFNAFTPELGGELYKSDGTTAGTVLLNDIRQGPDWSFPNSFFSQDKKSYFIDDNEIGTTICTTDGTSAGFKRYTAIINRDIYYVVNFRVTDNGQVFYILGNRFTGAYELWHSNGTDAGSIMLNSNLYYNDYVVNIGNTGFFVAGDFDHGYELWKSDGTLAGTKLVKDINPGLGGSYPYSLIAYKNKVYFGAYDGSGFNNTLWRTDGTEKGTVNFFNVVPAYFNENGADPAIQYFCVSGGDLYFSATDYNSYGAELWKTNGSLNGTQLVKDINPYYNSNPYNLIDVSGKLYFIADDGIHGGELWASEGADKTTKLVKDITPDYNSTNFFELCSGGDKVYFLIDGNKLWSSDGTDANTQQIDDPVVNGLTQISHLTFAGQKLFFGGNTFQYGNELYAGDVSGKTSTANKLSKVYVEEEKVVENLNAAIYPNPARSNAALQLNGNVKNIKVTITDVSGRAVWEKSFTYQHTINLPADKLNKGVYMITVKNDKESKTLKLIRL